MNRAKTVTLFDLVVTFSALGVLATVFVPVIAQAKQRGRQATTASNLRTIGAAANLYAYDYDGGVVLPQQGAGDNQHLWAVSLSPYIDGRGHAAFFDPTRAVPAGDTVSVAAVTLPWYAVTSLSINDAGYTGRYVTQGGTCNARKVAYVYGRSMAAMGEPNMRVAFAPTTWGGTDVGWSTFHAYESNWIRPSVPAGTFSYGNMVWNTSPLYTNGSIPVVHADGSAGVLNRGDFKDTVEAPTMAAYCSWMSTEGQRTWGPFWSPN